MRGAFEDLIPKPPRNRYGADRHPDLPWGYWLTSTGPVPGEPPLVDEDGTEWGSVREAFCVGRLGLGIPYGGWDRNVLDFLMSYMAIIDGRFVERDEKARDVFMGHRHFADFLEAFLFAAGLTDQSAHQLTLEGRAVLQMLIATRTREDANEKIGLDWIAATRTVAQASERRTAADLVEQREQVAARMAHRFKPDAIAGVPVVKLIGLRITEAVPVRSTLWTMAWPELDTHARNQFYLWLLERIDRWDDWSQMVTELGARALTEHFMKLAFCDRLGGLAQEDRSDG